MIKITNLYKKYGEVEVLKNINLELPRFGLVVIYGPSGCGKTTLLNCISGLLTYNGNIKIDSQSLDNLSDDSLSTFRLRNYGFIFQDFKLFESETVMDNILLPLEMLTDLKPNRKKQKCKDLLNLVGLKTFSHQFVKKLSGGEKQRVAIARSLVNDPSIILADEPTGALDSKNSEEIMNILEYVSLSSLVVVVSHDRQLTEKYADIIIEMKDGQIVDTMYQEHHKHEAYLPIVKNGYSNKIPSISLSFLLRHTYHSIKQRKWRTMICNLVTSLGLIGVGLAVSLSSSISTNIKEAYSSLIDQSKIMVSVKDNLSDKYGVYAGSYYEALDAKEKYTDYILDVGVDYIVDFESFFPEINCLCLQTNYYTPFDEISVRHINEFEWLDVVKPTVYPHSFSSLEDDEVVLGLTINLIEDICYALRIVRTVTSLSEYLEENDVYFYFDLANDDWQYSDQQLVNLKGFVLEKSPKIYHTNHMWNEYMLEERMRFPTVDNLVDGTQYPWVMRKIPYLYVNDDIDEFLSLARKDLIFDSILLEIANEQYYPWLLYNVDVRDVRRVLYLSNVLNNIPYRYIDYFSLASDNIDKPLFGNVAGYSIFPSALMMGFSNFTYFSFSEDLLIETLDSDSNLSLSMNETLSLPKGIDAGHYSRSMQDGVGFCPLNKNEQINGKVPSSLDEIVISSHLYNKLKIDENDTILYLSYTIDEKDLGGGFYQKYYKTVPLIVTGIINSEKNYIYHNSDWTVAFFQSRIGVSSFHLGITNIAFSMKDESKSDTTIKELKKAFPQYDIVNPLNGINESVDEVCSYIGISMIVFSIISTIISILLLSICNFLHIQEGKKEISLARCIGATRKEARKFLYAHSLVMCFVSFILSSIELIGVNIVSSFAISSALSSSTSLTFNPLSLLFMFVLAIIISLGSSYIISSKINKLNPLDGLYK